MMLSKIFPAFTVTLLIIVFVMAPLRAAQSQDRVIRFGLSDAGYPPYRMNNKDSLLGIVGDTFKAVVENMAYQSEVIILPKKRLQLEIKKGKVDAIAGAIEWQKKVPGMIWSDGVIRVSDNVVMPNSRMVNITDSTKLAGKHVVLMRGYTYPSLEASLKNSVIQATRVNGFSSLLKMVAANRVDYGVLDQNVAKWVMREQKVDLSDSLFFATPGFDEVSFRIIMYPTKDWGPFINEFNLALKAFQASPAWKKLLDRYR